MANPRNILRYIKHYGVKSTWGLVREKLFVDPRRFSVKKERSLPDFPAVAPSASLPRKKLTKSLNILYCIHYFYPKKKGGTERFTLNLAKEMQARGHKPYILVLEANESASLYTERVGDILYRFYEYDGIECIAFRHCDGCAPLGLYYKNITLSDVAMRVFAAALFRRFRIDLVHATYPQPFASFLDAARKQGIPYGVTCTDFCMTCHYATMVDDRGDFCGGSLCGEKCRRVCPTYGCDDFDLRRKNAEAVLRNAAFVTVPSDFVRRVMTQEFPQIDFRPVGHGIGDGFAYRARTGHIRRFVYAGTLSPLKGVHLLIEAFKSLPDDATLSIYGEGDGGYVKKLVAASDARIRFCGAVGGDEMPRVYHENDCVIVPSMWYETYNFVLREAAATGAFVLASDIGAMPEAVTVGKNGYLFRPADVADLAAKLRLAYDFDTESYEARAYPRLSDEGDAYESLYAATTDR